jgi:molybdenum cofactor cytidylyltransferase
MKLLAVILAAGEGRRMGSLKALLPWGETTLLAHVAGLLRRPGVASVCAVLGHEAERVRREAPVAHVTLVDNPDHREGMLSSIRCGLDYAARHAADAVLVHPVDHPLVEPATIDRVIAALQAGARIAVPSWDGRRGHPAGWSREVWPAIETARPERGARAVLAEHPEWVVHVDGDPGCREGINTPEEYESVRFLGGGRLSE